jgi:hypothetical protein
MVAVYFYPFSFLIHFEAVLMDEVTSKSINAAFLIQKRVTIFGFVRNVDVCVTSQFVGPVSELAFVTIRAQSSLSEIFT